MAQPGASPEQNSGKGSEQQNPHKNPGATAKQNLGGAHREQHPHENPEATATHLGGAHPEQNPQQIPGAAAQQNPRKNPEATAEQNLGGASLHEGSGTRQNPGQTLDFAAAAAAEQKAHEASLPAHPTTGQGAVYTAVASGAIADLVFNRASTFEIKNHLLELKEDETDDDRLFRIAHMLYMRMNRSLKSPSDA